MSTKTAAERRSPVPKRASARRVRQEVSEAGRMERLATRQWIRLGDVRVNAEVQRELVPGRAASIASRFNPELFDIPKVNHRGGLYWVVDGQHRVEALKIWLGDGWEDQHFEADVYEDLVEAEEGELFLGLNDKMSVSAFTRFRIAVKAGRPDEVAVNRIVEQQGLVISKDVAQVDKAVKAVGTLLRVYQSAGDVVLARTLAVLRDAYGVPGLQALTIAGMALVMQRYGDLITDDNDFVRRLSQSYGGVGGVMNKAERARKETGNQKTICVAAALVDTYNAQAKRSGAAAERQKITSWWRER